MVRNPEEVRLGGGSAVPCRSFVVSACRAVEGGVGELEFLDWAITYLLPNLNEWNDDMLPNSILLLDNAAKPQPQPQPQPQPEPQPEPEPTGSRSRSRSRSYRSEERRTRPLQRLMMMQRPCACNPWRRLQRAVSRNVATSLLRLRLFAKTPQRK